MKKSLFTIIAVIFILISSYFIGNFVTNSFNDELFYKSANTIIGLQILLFAFLIFVIVYSIYKACKS